MIVPSGIVSGGLAALLMLPPAPGLAEEIPSSPRGVPAVEVDSTAATRAPSRDSSSVAAPTPVLVLPEVRVERERLAEARRRLPTAFVTELRAGASGRALETLSEVLSQAASVHILQYGGLGSFSTVSLRGAPAGQVTVFLDGRPLTSAAHGVVNLADLPVTAVDRVEVYRGLAPLGLGVATPGGAINLVTLSGAGPAELRVARGSFDTWEARGTSTLRRGALTGLLHAGYQGSEGDFRYPDDNGTPFNAADDSTSTRLNNRFDATTALASIEFEPSGAFRASLREDFFHKTQGVPGLGAVPALHPRLSFLRSLTSLDVEKSGRGPWPSVRLGAGLERERTRFRDTGSELGLGTHDTDDHADGENALLAMDWPRIPGGLSIQTAGSWREERARLADAADPFADPPPSRRRTLGAAATIQLHAFRERLVLHAANRWDRLDDHLRANAVAGTVAATDVTRDLGSPQLGVRLGVLGTRSGGSLGRGVELRANWTKASRAPDFLELFGNQGSVLGNPQLAPEHAENWDAGLAAWGALGAWSGGVEWAHFESDSRDLVLYVRNSQSSVRAQNVSRAAIAGDEFTLRVASPAGLALSGSYSAERAVDRGPVPFWRGRHLPQRPAREGHARLDGAAGPVRFALDLHAIDANWLDRANRQRAPSRALLGASITFSPFGGALALTVEGKNLGDAKASDVGGFPLPGRSLFVSCRTRLGPARSASAASRPSSSSDSRAAEARSNDASTP